MKSHVGEVKEIELKNVKLIKVFVFNFSFFEIFKMKNLV
jgi:hypothetical protein